MPIFDEFGTPKWSEQASTQWFGEETGEMPPPPSPSPPPLPVLSISPLRGYPTGDEDEWAAHPRTAAFEKPARGPRADEIEARLRLSVPEWSERDRRLPFPWGLFLFLILLSCLAIGALGYFYMNWPDRPLLGW